MKLKHGLMLAFLSASFLVGCANPTNNDVEFLAKANNIVNANKDKITTTYDAVTILKENGVDAETHVLSNKNYDLVFDIASKNFVIMEGDKFVFAPDKYVINDNTYNYFKFTDKYDASIKYSQYLTSNFTGADLLVVTTGLDMGSNRNIKNIIYNNSSLVAKEVTLRTFCDYLNINAPLDTLNLYYAMTNVFVTSAKEVYARNTASSAYFQVSAGDVYFDNGAVIDLFEIPEGCNVVTHTEEKAVIYGALNAPYVPTINKLNKKDVYGKDDLYDISNSDETYNFYRIMTDITLDSTEQTLIDNGAFLTVGHVCLIDLNGKRLSFINNLSNTYKGTGFTGSIVLDSMVGEKEIDCYLLDSQSTVLQRSGIYEEDCSIIVRGSNVNAANLTINGGKISAYRINQSCPAAISIGQNAEDKWIKKDERTEENKSKSNITMYGGYIDISSKDPSKIACKALQPKGWGASLDMIYGDLRSDGYCISTMGNIDDQFGGIDIKITSGTFTSSLIDYPYTPGVSTDRGYSCLFFPAGGDVTILGGTFKGTTCINAKSGNINIKNSQFIATGSYVPTTGCVNGVFSDGSVFTIESNHKAYELKKTGNWLNVTIDNCTAISKQGYIIRYVGVESIERPYPEVIVNIDNTEGYYTKDNFFEYQELDRDKLKELFHITEANNVWTKTTNE